jgi:carbon-monoxide dehydrogenase large subunit
MGEGGTIGAPSAIANALADALAPFGVEIFELPMTSERLFCLVEKLKAAPGRSGDRSHGAAFSG